MPHDPTDETAQEVTSETPAETVATPPPAPTPSYVTVEQFMEFQTSMQQMLQSTLQAATQRPQPQAEPTFEEPSDEELDNAALEGKGVGRAVKRAIRATEARLRRETANETAQVRDIGLPALASIALHNAKQTWEPEYYDKYKREIDQAIAALPPEFKADMDKLNLVYSTVIGLHRKEIIAMEKEKAVRQAREPQDTQVPRGRGREITPSANDLPEDRDLFGPESVAGLRNLGRGRSIEDIAKKLGYNNPDEYRAKVLKYQREQRGAA